MTGNLAHLTLAFGLLGNVVSFIVFLAPMSRLTHYLLLRFILHSTYQICLHTIPSTSFTPPTTCLTAGYSLPAQPDRQLPSSPTAGYSFDLLPSHSRLRSSTSFTPSTTDPFPTPILRTATTDPTPDQSGESFNRGVCLSPTTLYLCCTSCCRHATSLFVIVNAAINRVFMFDSIY
ncbi:hypothetical protein L2E82_16106 [Cichorium intybus]|uniref:Uncharacterized protein n=1 Tax=Cichorium intybus TaxID=13427 RepID=A0ACB9F4L4_CICIN|nr:hypothetical protein L2E82_16106 [Cichorium intybus]